MAKLKMTIPEGANPRAYIPKELIDEGFTGEVEILADAKTATILHPQATLEEVRESLKIVLQDINLRLGNSGKSNK